MSLLLVVVLLFFSSVSSHQYYVSDDCSSVTHTPCNPLSVYAENVFQYSNSTFYFIGTSLINDDINLNLLSTYNISWQGMNKSSIIKCANESSIILFYGHHFNISYLSFHECILNFISSYNTSMSYFSLSGGYIIIVSTRSVAISNFNLSNGLMYIFNSHDTSISCLSMSGGSIGIKYTTKLAISNSTLSQIFTLSADNAFDLKIVSTVITGGYRGSLDFQYDPPDSCSYELNTYSLELINVSVHTRLDVSLYHSSSYNLSVNINDAIFNGISFDISPLSLHWIQISNTSSHSSSSNFGLRVESSETQQDTSCNITNIQNQSYFIVKNCHFYNNAYGFSMRDKAVVLIEECFIYNNVYGFGIYELESDGNISIVNTNVFNNDRNIISRSEAFLSNISITNTVASGLTLQRANVTVADSLYISNNTGTNGGGLAVYEDSFLRLLPEARVDIVGNHATEKGGGIFTNNYLYCPFQSDFSLPPVYVNVSSNFADLVGYDVYGYLSEDNCASYFSENTRSAADPQIMCFCDPSNASIIYGESNCFKKVEKQAFPGQRLKFNIIMIGLSYSEDKVTAGDVDVYFDNNILMERQSILANCSSVEIKLQTADYTRHNVRFSFYQNFDSFSVTNTQSPSVNESLVYSLLINECPIGFSVNGSSECDCSQSVYRLNVTCDINTQSITHNGLLWIGTYDTGASFNANATNSNACIVNEDCLLYCSPNPVTFQLNDTDTQCVDNRGQRMCGSCTDGYSLLMGSNKCGHCNDKHTYIVITWLLLFAVMGILLVFLLIALNLTVSVGTLNGLLFYANIVKLYEPVFSREGALPVLNQVISWINLDFGFEACLYNGMDSYAKQWLQFAFPLYLWIIIIIIIQLCRRYGKMSKLMGSHAVPVLSTLFLLSYTKLVRTIVIVLHQREVTLHCTNESVRSVSLWYEDPNVEYAKGKHAGLLAFALVVFLIFILPYTLFLLLDPLYEKYLSNYKVFKKVWGEFKPVIDAYSGPMKDQYRFWPGLLLVARIPILLSVTLVDSFIESQHFLLCMLLTVLALLFSMQVSFGGLYRKRLYDIVEVWFLFNLCIMVSLSIAFNTDEEVLIWFNTCIGIFTISFIIIIFYHFYLQISKEKWFKSLLEKMCKKQKESVPTVEDIVPHKTVDMQMSEKVPTRTVLRKPSPSRESVVELF